MAQVELILPKMGESVAEATITSWLANEGDQIELEDPILEIATDKVDSEVPSTAKGTLLKQLHKVGDVVKVGEALAIISTTERRSIDQEKITKKPLQDAVSAGVEEATVEQILPKKIVEHAIVKQTKDKTPSDGDTEKIFYSPLVKSIALKENISPDELEKIPGTGKNNRLTKKDLLDYVETKGNSFESKSSSTIKSDSTSKAAKSISGKDEIIEMDRMRKLIAQNMIKSKQISAHVTSMLEVDVTSMVLWRNKIKDDFAQKQGYKITFTPLFVEAVAKALRDFPMINISIEGDKITVKKDINVGIAVALPTGNLIVPVVKNADELNLIGLAKVTNDLAVKARNNKLIFEDIEGGTFTLTNIGTFGNAIGTPIINQPEVAIMSTGLVQKKPAVIETPQGDTIGIRHMMFLSMSYDHRVVDGMLGGSFLRKVGDYLENFDINRQLG
jgi:2-oxoglutarate dehydrogenase E2 component (dihydrolipoamide succinyltransferase)